jgi:hypothetical protein
MGEGVDEDETAAGLGVRGEGLGPGQAVAACVGDLDTDGAGDHVEREPEVTARDPAMCSRVRRQLGHHVLRRIQRKSPGAELLGGEQPGEASTARRGGEERAEVADGVAELGREGGGFLIHVTQRGGGCLP